MPCVKNIQFHFYLSYLGHGGIGVLPPPPGTKTPMLTPPPGSSMLQQQPQQQQQQPQATQPQKQGDEWGDFSSSRYLDFSPF